METQDAPAGRAGARAIWTGTQMIVWGGATSASELTNSGGRFNPSDGQLGTWTPTSTTNAPSPRKLFTMVWSGQRVIIWGGQDELGNPLNDGGIYDPAFDTWQAMSVTGAPDPRYAHSAV